jgi:hypothetical protein
MCNLVYSDKSNESETITGKNPADKIHRLSGEKFQSRSQNANSERVKPVIENTVKGYRGKTGTNNCFLPFELIRISQGPRVEIEMRINDANPINFEDLSRWIEEQLEDYKF